MRVNMNAKKCICPKSWPVPHIAKADCPQHGIAGIDADFAERLFKPLLDHAKAFAVEHGARPCPVFHREGADCPVCEGVGLVLPDKPR